MKSYVRNRRKVLNWAVTAIVVIVLQTEDEANGPMRRMDP